MKVARGWCRMRIEVEARGLVLGCLMGCMNLYFGGGKRCVEAVWLAGWMLDAGFEIARVGSLYRDGGQGVISSARFLWCGCKAWEIVPWVLIGRSGISIPQRLVEAYPST